MKWKFIPLILVFVTIQSYSQTNPIERITFEHENSIKLNSKITISIYRNYDYNNSIKVVSIIKGIKKETDISKEKFDVIGKLLKKICAADLLIESFNIVLDSPVTNITFGDMNSSITYGVRTLNTIDKPTGYKKLTRAVELILETAGTNLNEINK